MEEPLIEPPKPEVTLPADIWEAGLRILKEPDVFEKVRLSHAFNQAYKDGLLPLPPLPVPQEKVDAEVPAVPARPSPPPQLSRKAKPIESTIHGIAHAESYAIDLMWDLIVRFASDPALKEEEFYSDFVEIADQEARHFMSWVDRLRDFGIEYGQLPGTQTLWDAATATSDDVMARLALVNLLHEARGLDTFVNSHKRLERSGDEKSATTLQHNYREEIHHVKMGRKWFEHVHRCRGLDKPPTEVFQGIIRERYRGRVVGPFNDAARLEAGMGPEWYIPLTEPQRDTSATSATGDAGKGCHGNSGCCEAVDN